MSNKMQNHNRANALLIVVNLLVVSFSFVHAEEEWPEPVKDQIYSFLVFDQLEHRWNDGSDNYVWDGQGWIGGDYQRFWFKFEGDYQPAKTDSGETETQLLYSRLIAPFWDFQLGLRYDQLFGESPNRTRTFAVVGVQGLAPYVFELEPAIFISHDGDMSARFIASYDLLITQKLIVQPRVELNAAAQDVKEFGVGSGLNDLQLDLRIRYEIYREFAPYIGFSWTQLFGETKDLAHDDGEDSNNFAVIAGVRVWF